MRLKNLVFLVVSILILHIAFAENIDQSQIDTTFILREGSQCGPAGWTWIYVDPNTGDFTSYETLHSLGWCTGEDGLKKTEDDCCPIGYECDGETDEDAKCVPLDIGDGRTISSCGDYDSEFLSYYKEEIDTSYSGTLEELCNEDPFEVTQGLGSVSRTVYVAEQDASITTPSSESVCVWDNENGCVLEETTSESIYEGENGNLFTCHKDFEKDSSLPGGRVNYSWIATPTWEDGVDWNGFVDICREKVNPACTEEDVKQAKLEAGGCVSGSQIILVRTTKLGFFGFKNFFAALALVILVYVLLIVRKNLNKKVENFVKKKRKK